MKAGPPADRYDDVVEDDVVLTGRDGAEVDAVLFRPAADGRHPGIVIGAEATGINAFIRRVGATLAHHGFVTIIPDYYRGGGPPDPEAYEDFETMLRFIDALDFRQATHDLLAGITHLRSQPFVDEDRVATWGYCTGATLALLAAELDPSVAATVLFYPSQPTFAALTDTTPVHPVDLLWALRCPVLLLYGDQDVVMSAEQLAEVRRRLESGGVDHRIVVYSGAGHAFCSETPMLFDERAAEDSWGEALTFIERLRH